MYRYVSQFLERLPEFIGANPILAMGFVGLSAAIVINEISRLRRGYKSASPSELTTLMNRDNALVVDVSAIADFEKGHILGAKHVALSQFDPENKLLAKLRELPVAVVCRTGMTSHTAAAKLVKAGFKNVYLLEGGVQAWQSADLPLVRGKA
jgi:rhodanese-related sulfurtransferase